MKETKVTVRVGGDSQTLDFTGKITKLRKTITEVRKLERERERLHNLLKAGKISVWSEFHSIDEPINDKQITVVYNNFGLDFGGNLVQFIYDTGGDLMSSLEVILDAINEDKEEVWM